MAGPLDEFKDWHHGNLDGSWPDHLASELNNNQQSIVEKNAELLCDRKAWDETIQRFEEAIIYHYSHYGDEKIKAARNEYTICFTGFDFSNRNSNFTDYKFPCNVNFCGSIFESKSVSFRNTTFMGETNDFSFARFGSGNVNFSSAKFLRGSPIFSGVNFGNGDVNFLQVQFGNGNVVFEGANFGDGNINFRNVAFGVGEVNFNGASFGTGNVDFKESKFDHGDIQFGQEINFGKGYIDFSKVSFGTGKVDFSSAIFEEGYISFRKAIFGDGEIDFTKVNFGEGDVNFQKVNFGNGNVSFHSAKSYTGDIDFRKTNFGNGEIDFSRASFADGIVDFTGAKFVEGNVKFRNITMLNGKMDFKNVTFGKGDINFDFEKIKESDFSAIDMVVNENLYVKGKFPNGALFRRLKVDGTASFANSEFENEVPDFRDAKFERPPEVSNMKVPKPKLEELGLRPTFAWLRFPLGLRHAEEKRDVQKFRKLKAMALEAHDHEKDVEFFAYEMMAKRGWETKWGGLFFNSLYRWCSNYGRSMWRPFVIMLFSFFFFACIYEKHSVDDMDSALLLSLQNSFPLFSGETNDFKGLSIAQKLVSTIFLFLFLLAVRNKFRLK